MATNVTLAPLLISNDAHECLKSWILITFKPARFAKHKLEIITNKKEIEINKKEYQDIIDYLNYKTNSNFILIDEYKKIIANILKKYTINDIKTVIDKKTSEWINNPKMKPYLTPETLFGTKFERYLHQQAKAKTIQDISLEEIRRAKEMRDKQNG